MQIKVEWSQRSEPEISWTSHLRRHDSKHQGQKKENEQTKIFKKKTCEEARANYDAETLNDNQTVSGGEIEGVETFQSITGKP